MRKHLWLVQEGDDDRGRLLEEAGTGVQPGKMAKH